MLFCFLNLQMIQKGYRLSEKHQIRYGTEARYRQPTGHCRACQLQQRHALCANHMYWCTAVLHEQVGTATCMHPLAHTLHVHTRLW